MLVACGPMGIQAVGVDSDVGATGFLFGIDHDGAVDLGEGTALDGVAKVADFKVRLGMRAIYTSVVGAAKAAEARPANSTAASFSFIEVSPGKNIRRL